MVGSEPIRSLLSYFATNATASRTRENTSYLQSVQKHVTLLFDKDYEVKSIDNSDGRLCVTYPLELLVLEKSRHGGPRVNDRSQLVDVVTAASATRVHGRFAFPVLLVRDRNICRSGTISNQGENVLNHVSTLTRTLLSFGEGSSSSSQSGSRDGSALEPSTSFSLDRQRRLDVRLLHQLRIGTIFDLMVEQRKKKYGLYLCSSEKVDMEGRYSSFRIAAVPYPGCEFFNTFAKSGHVAEGLFYDWAQPLNDSILQVDPFYTSAVMPDWEKYRTWDLATLTRHYVNLLLAMVADPSPGSNPGVLIHCISGWDRTPTFVSILRILMWAEGEAHQSLSTEEMLYLTLGYDWLLFCHHLEDRRSREEDIFHFAFYALELLERSDCSLRHWTKVVAAKRQAEKEKIRTIVGFSVGGKPEPVSPNDSADAAGLGDATGVAAGSTTKKPSALAAALSKDSQRSLETALASPIRPARTEVDDSDAAGETLVSAAKSEEPADADLEGPESALLSSARAAPVSVPVPVPVPAPVVETGSRGRILSYVDLGDPRRRGSLSLADGAGGGGDQTGSFATGGSLGETTTVGSWTDGGCKSPVPDEPTSVCNEEPEEDPEAAVLSEYEAQVERQRVERLQAIRHLFFSVYHDSVVAKPSARATSSSSSSSSPSSISISPISSPPSTSADQAQSSGVLSNLFSWIPGLT